MKQLDILSYLLLFSGIVLGTVAFFRLRVDPKSQMFVIFGLVSFYFLWGIVYHWGRKDLTKKLFLEYFLIGAICAIVGFLVFFL